MQGEPTDPWAVSPEEYPEEGTDEDRLRYLLRWAILAPSGHNTQPWLFRIEDGELEIRPDWTRALPVVDPTDRELVMSCGCALFHLRITLRRFGHHGDIRRPVDDAGADFLATVRHVPEVLARVRLGPDHDPGPAELRLFRSIKDRHTNRQRFHDRQVEDELLDEFRAAAREEGAWLHVLRSDDRRDALAELIAEGDRIQGADPSFRRELAAWIHPNRSRSRDGMPGYAFGIGDLASYAGPLVVRRFDWGDRRAAEDRELAEGSPVLAVLGTDRDTPAAWTCAGQALDRVLLRAAADGVSASYLNQPVELPELRPRVTDLLDREGWAQIVLRMGYGPEVERSTPRRPVSEVMLED